MGGGGVLDGRDVLDLMHDRSRMNIDPRILQCRGGTCRAFTDQANMACHGGGGGGG